MPAETTDRLWSTRTLFFFGCVLLLSYLTYFHRYFEPAAVFWDENYHIAAAQKYLHGVYFMESHPPLGKLLVALGEKMLRPNPETDQFIDTDYASNFPKGFSFRGYRLFPALFGWLAAPLFFLLFLRILRDALQATFLSFVYIFDNALIVHLRGAMLEGPLVFFSISTILLWFLLYEEVGKWKERSGKRKTGALSSFHFPLSSFLFGCSFGAVFATKVTGLILIFLTPALLFHMWRNRKFSFHFHHSVFRFVLPAVFGFLLLYVGSWHAHFALGSTVRAGLPDNGFYQASGQYKAILATKKNSSLAAFPIMIRDSWNFLGHYNRGAPRLDLCKSDENGSPFIFWPIGARTINYRWETPDGQRYRYLYLVANPVVWFAGLSAVVLAAALLISSVLAPPREKLSDRFVLLVFLGLYVTYMIVMSRIDRVMYMYHYFIPLLFSFVLLGLLWKEIRRVGTVTLTPQRKTAGLMGFALLVFASFQFFRPLTYYEPLTDAQFKRRAMLPVWELSCVNCPRENSLAVPR